MAETMEATLAPAAASAVCPWDDVGSAENATVSVSVCPWDDEEAASSSKQPVTR